MMEGVSRTIGEGVDPDYFYKNLVLETAEGGLTTGYSSAAKNARHGMHFTREEIRDAGRGLTKEPAAIWSARDEIQQKMVSTGRKLPYLLPSMYVAQRGFSDPLFGYDENRRKVKWYNPVDVVADFAKQSVINTFAILAPFDAASAGLSTARRSLATSLYSSPKSLFQENVQKRFVDLTTIMDEVGHDLTKVTNRVIRTSTQLSSAFNSGIEKARTDQPNQGQIFRSVRESARKTQQNTITGFGKQIFLGGKEEGSSVSGSYGLVDLIPTLRGFRSGFSNFRDSFRTSGQAYDALNQAISNDQAIRRIAMARARKSSKTPFDSLAKGDQEEYLDAARISLNKAKESIAYQHQSRLTSFVSTIDELMAGHNTYGNRQRLKEGKFFEEALRSELRTQVRQHLNAQGVSRSASDLFARQVTIKKLPRGGARLDTSQVFTIGKDDIFKSTDVDFFAEMSIRASGIKGFKDSGLSGDVLQRALNAANRAFSSKEFQVNVEKKIKSQWRTFYDKDLINHTSGLLKPQVMTLRSFTGQLSTQEKEYLQRKSASVLGLKMIDEQGKRTSSDIVNNFLARNALDSENFTSLRAFLLNNKQLSKPLSSSGYNFLGLRPVSFDEARNRGFFNYLDERQQRILLDINRQMGFKDPISDSIGHSVVNGLYSNKSGQIIDTTKLTGTLRSLGNFFASEFEIPLVHLNANSLFGLNQFQDMAKKGPIHFVPGNSIQPFLGAEANTDARFFIYETKRSFLRKTKGTVTAYLDQDGSTVAKKLPGYYRPGNNLSQAFIARQARFASGLTGDSISSARADGGQLSFTERVKSKLDFSDEQPTSLFQYISRFAKRKTDINNPQVIAKLLRERTARYGRRTLRLDMQGEGPSTIFNVVDDNTGKVLVGNEEFLRSFSKLMDDISSYGFSNKVIQGFEESSSDSFKNLFKFQNRPTGTASQQQSVSKLQTVKDAIEFAQQLKYVDRKNPAISEKVKSSFSRIDQILEEGNLLSASSVVKRSPSISTKLDELKSELAKYLYLRNTSTQQTLGINNQPIVELNQVLTSLRQRGVISAEDFVEAQAAALSTLTTRDSHLTYSAKQTATGNIRAAAHSIITGARSSEELKGLLKPLTDGSIDQVTSQSRRFIRPIIPSFSRQFKTAPYSTINERPNVLGGNSNSVLIPTFGTVFSRDPLGAIASAVGFSNYANPNTFSGMSVASGHAVERLNRYFGTLGMQLDVSKYSSPADLYAMGMVTKRVLPIVAGASTIMTADRTIGGFVNERDINNERVYSPYFMGALSTGIAETQSAISGVIPGGMSYQEKREQLTEGKVPIRQGRFWPLGNTPFEGGKIMYYRPSWYQKMQAGALFTSDTYGSPLEKALYYNDYSPLRPFDPYRFETKHYYDRPYPVTGEYFTGPFGPLTPILNATVGKILKPTRQMHQERVEAGLVNYTAVGQSGAYDVSPFLMSEKNTNLVGSSSFGMMNTQNAFGSYNINNNIGESINSLGTISPNQSNIQVGSVIGGINSRQANMAVTPLATAGMDVQNRIALQNRILTTATFGPPKLSGSVSSRIVPAGSPIETPSIEFQSTESAYKIQEMLGIYGFIGGSLRDKFGFGQSDFEPQRSVLQSASKAYGTGRAFWDLNLGGLGDVPLSGQGAIGNLEISEVIRRFIPKERTNVNYINPIQNTMGQKYPFLPGADYFINFKTGDPFTKIQEGELRLPGIAYERFNSLSSDDSGRYGIADQFSILGNIAPYSAEYRSLNRSINSQIISPEERIKVSDTREQVLSMTNKKDFSPYKYKYTNAEEAGMTNSRFMINRAAEYFAHRDTIFNTKFLPTKTAAEDYEKTNVYGSTFPEWQRPFESFLDPMVYKATQRGPFVGASVMAAVGSVFGVTSRAKVVGSLGGGLIGGGAGVFGQVSETVTGQRFIPEERKKQMALEEYVDILSYVKNMSLSSQAQQEGDSLSAQRYKSAAGRTMYGADIYGASIENLSLAIPKRKREHFRAMINAPVEERQKILSTAPRLERRIFEAAWGMDVEDRPDLDEYFSDRELPEPDWEGWHPNTNMDHVKIKMGESMGINMSQMGYYPQQVREAELVNPSYPEFKKEQDSENVAAQIRMMMSRNGISGNVVPVLNGFGSSGIDIYSGVR